MILNTVNAARSATTMLAPAGVENTYEAVIPVIKHTTDTQAEHIITDLKRLNTLIAVRAGKTISPDISRVPIIRIPRTMVRAVSRARSIL